MLNIHTFVLQHIFSGWGNELSPEKNLHHFCFWHPPSFDFYIVILSPGTNEFFLPDRLKNPIQLASPRTICQTNIKGDMERKGMLNFSFIDWKNLDRTCEIKHTRMLMENCLLYLMSSIQGSHSVYTLFKND